MTNDYYNMNNKISYYDKKELKQIIHEFPELKNVLFSKGFLITTNKGIDIKDYPFYGDWKKNIYSTKENRYFFYTSKKTRVSFFEKEDILYFLIGYAVNPIKEIFDEHDILTQIAKDGNGNSETICNQLNNLTGVFCLGYINRDGRMFYSTDCCGMQMVYHGIVNNDIYISSHSKLIADICNLKQSDFVKKYISNRFYHFFGMSLPGDLSPYENIKRVQPNFMFSYSKKNHSIEYKRYYPLKEIKEVCSKEEISMIIEELSRILKITIDLFVKKYDGKEIGLSVTGGRDSLTTLSCSRKNIRKLNCFSYISKEGERIDAIEANNLCSKLGIHHKIYKIPKVNNSSKEFSAFEKIMNNNAGCIGKHNRNDVEKQYYFWKNKPFDIEIKSWVNEIGRGWYYTKYRRKKFPKKPNNHILRAMHKICFSPYLISKSNLVFDEYLKKYYNGSIFQYMSWLDVIFWEFSWSAGEGLFLTSEQRTTYDVFVPFNNRLYIEKMLQLPLKYRIEDRMPIDIIKLNYPEVLDNVSFIKDLEHTDFRSFFENIYFIIFSRF